PRSLSLHDALPIFDAAELLLAIGVLGVLRTVALGRRGRQRLDHLGALHAPQVVELGLEPRVALAGDQRGALLGGWTPATHGSALSVGGGMGQGGTALHATARYFRMLPSSPRTIRLVIVRAACLPAACTTPGSEERRGGK